MTKCGWGTSRLDLGARQFWKSLGWGDCQLSIALGWVWDDLSCMRTKKTSMYGVYRALVCIPPSFPIVDSSRVLLFWASQAHLEDIGTFEAEVLSRMVAHKRCYMVEGVARHELPHPPRSPLCDKEWDYWPSLDFLCVLTPSVVCCTSSFGPSQDDDEFQSWWRWSTHRAPKVARKGLNTLVILIVWTIQKHRNWCMFENISPLEAMVLHEVHDQGHLWVMVGTKGARLSSRTIVELHCFLCN